MHQRDISESDQYFRRIFEDNPMPMAVTRPDGHFEDANAAFEQMLGYSAEELGKMTFRDLTHPENLEESTRQLQRLMAGEFPLFRTEKRYIARDGRVVWGVTTVSAVRHSDGSIRSKLVMVQDITERHIREKALRSSEQSYRYLVDNLNVGVFRSNLEGHFLHANQAVVEMAGYDSLEELLALPTSRLYTNPQDRQRLVEELLRTGEVHAFELLSTRKDGSSYPISMTAKLMQNSVGEQNTILGIVEDLSKRKKAEEALQQTQRLESLGMLAGGIAHDFNNLLTSIFGFMEIAHNATSDNKIQACLGDALKAHDRAVALTKQLLTFARGGEPHCSPGNIAPLLQSAARFVLAGKNVSCSFDLEEGLPICDFDEHQISQMINNVLINAQQAMPNGGHIEIGAHRSTCNSVHIFVRDTGVGITADVLPRIFDPFFTTKKTGSGLGLAICHSIVMKHGGRIEVESTPEVGSTFHIYLPSSKRLLSLSPPPTESRAYHGVGSVLIMDDEPNIRTILGEVLSDLGHTPLFARNGAEALQLLQREFRAQRNVAAVFMDLTIPGSMGGPETISELRRQGFTVPVFAMSGYNDNPVMARPQDFGFNGSLCKPMRLRDLGDFLARHLIKNNS